MYSIWEQAGSDIRYWLKFCQQLLIYVGECTCILYVQPPLVYYWWYTFTSPLQWWRRRQQGDCRRLRAKRSSLTDSVLGSDFAYLPTFGRLNPESFQTWWRIPFRNVLVFSLNNFHSLPPPPRLRSPVCLLSESLSLCPWRAGTIGIVWLPTNHLSIVTTCPEWETWHPVGGKLDLFWKICNSVIFWDECGIHGSNADRLHRMRKGWQVWSWLTYALSICSWIRQFRRYNS